MSNTLLAAPYAIAGFLGILIIGLGVSIALLVQAKSGARAKLRARAIAIAGGAIIAEVSSNSENSRRTKEVQRKLRELEQSGAANRRMALRQRIVQAGLNFSVRNYYIWSAFVGIGSTFIYLLLGYPVIGTVAVLIAMGFGAPRFYLRKLATKRQKRFTQNFADAIDVIVRGIRTGLPVPECLQIVARESPDPIGSEFSLVVEGQKIGMTLNEVLDRAVRRMPTTDMKFFAIVLTMQQQTGGNLADTLSNLSVILRSRKKLTEKIHSMSAEARMTAMIIGSLPFLLSGMLFLISPDYMSVMWTDSFGQILFFGGIVWMALGILVMKKLVSFGI